MKAHKVTIMIVDFDNIGAEEVKDVIESTDYPNHCIYPEVASVETVDIGEWNDDHPLNHFDTAKAEWQRIFPSLKEGGLAMRLCDEGHPPIAYESMFRHKEGYCLVCETRLEIERHEKEEERLKEEIRSLKNMIEKESWDRYLGKED